MFVTLTIFQDLDLGFWRRFCCLLPLFDDFGYISLMICAKGLPIPSPVFRQRFSLSLNSLWAFFVSLRLVSAMTGLTSRHSGGLDLRCLFNESSRAKKSPQWSQNEMRTGAEPALEHADRAACPVIRCRFEESPVPPVESWRDVEESPLPIPRPAFLRVVGRLFLLWHCVVNLVPHGSLYTPLNPRQLFLRDRTRQSLLLDAWSLQRWIGISLRIQDCEPLRSAARCLEFQPIPCMGPSARTETDPTSGPSRL